MTMKDYLQDKAFIFLFYGMMVVMTLLMLLAFHVNISLIILIMGIDFWFISIIEVFDYQRKKQFYTNYLSQLKMLEEKYLICELIKEPSFLEGRILYQSLYDINKSMLEKINDLSMNMEDFKDYVEMWIHEVKIPLSHLTLTVHNHKSEVSLQILEQVRKLENQVDQILYYVRSQSAQKDYLVKNNHLSQMIKNVIVKNKDYFIFHQLKIRLPEAAPGPLGDQSPPCGTFGHHGQGRMGLPARRGAGLPVFAGSGPRLPLHHSGHHRPEPPRQGFHRRGRAGRQRTGRAPALPQRSFSAACGSAPLGGQGHEVDQEGADSGLLRQYQ